MPAVLPRRLRPLAIRPSPRVPGHGADAEVDRIAKGGGGAGTGAVADLAAARDAVTAAGGTVVADPGGGFACMVRDPDGQLIELVNEKVRPVS